MTLEEEFQAWASGIPVELTADPVWHCTAYRLALFAADRAWNDLGRLTADARTIYIAEQLGRSLGGISANYLDAYSRSSPGDRCRFYEYSLGEAREARGWYFKGRRVIGEDRVRDAIQLLTRIAQLLTVTIVRERARVRRPRRSLKPDDA